MRLQRYLSSSLAVIAAAIILVGCSTPAIPANVGIGFEGEVPLTDLTKAEIVHNGWQKVWHGRFNDNFYCDSAIAGRVEIPKGFITDAASIPRIFWNILSDTDPDIEYPSFVHDLLYSVHGKLPDRTLTRDQCDHVIREQMLVLNCPRWKANAVYEALHLFGWHGWNQHTPAYKLERTTYAPRLEAVRRP
jgi:hypothetical protein